MFFSIKYKNVHYRCWASVTDLDVIELVDFTNFVKTMFLQSPILFTTNFTTMFKNKIVKFEPSDTHEVFIIEAD